MVTPRQSTPDRGGRRGMTSGVQDILGVPPDLADQPWELVFRLQPPGWLILLLVLGCLAVPLWGYARLRGPRLPRVLLAGARAASIGLVVALSLQPVIEWPRERKEPDSVVVLVDRSRSLMVSDERTTGNGRSSRDERLQAILKDPVWERVKTSHPLQWVGFTGTTSLISDPLKLPPATGGRTLLSASLQEAMRSMEGRLVGSMVVLTDGRSQDIVDPGLIASLRREGISVFTVPLGDPQNAADRAIVEVDHPQRAFARDQIPVRVLIDAKGPVAVTLRDRETGRVLDRSQAVPDGENRFRATLTGQNTGSTDTRWEVVLEPEGVDADPSNDRRGVEISSVDRPIRVLYLDGRPRWEFRYLRSILLREEGVESSIMLLSADRDFAQEGTAPLARLPSTAEEFLPFDVIMIGDLPAGSLDAARQKVIREQVARRGTGLIWIGGERHTPMSWEGSPLEDLLPLRGSLDLPRWDEPVLLQPSTEASRLGLLVLGQADEPWPQELGSNAEPWARLEWAQRVEPERLKPTAEVWATAWRIRSDGVVEATPDPLMLSMRYGAGTSVYVATDETWRWRYGRGETLQERFWVPMIRHLARLGLRADPGSVSLMVEPSTCATGQPVRITVDGGGRILVDEVVVEARLRGGVEVREIRLRPEGDGRFGTTWAPEREGVWDFQLTQPRLDGVESASLQARSEDAEGKDTTPDHTTLMKLAQESGGQMVAPTDIGSLDRRLPERAVTVRQPIQMPLWDRWFLYAALALLLAAEWLGRRAMRLA
jgi:hypothetical protein